MAALQIAPLSGESPHLSLYSFLRDLRFRREKLGDVSIQDYSSKYTELATRRIDLAGIVRDSEISIYEFEIKVGEISLNTQPTLGDTQTKQTSWSIFTSLDEAGILTDLVESGGHRAAQRLNDLIEMFASDPDVGKLNFDSFKSVAEFFKKNNDLEPAIVAGWDGTLAVEWRLPPIDPQNKEQTCRGILCLEFLSNGRIEYSGFVSTRDGEEEAEYEGSTGQNNIIEKIHPFLQKM